LCCVQRTAASAKIINYYITITYTVLFYSSSSDMLKPSFEIHRYRCDVDWFRSVWYIFMYLWCVLIFCSYILVNRIQATVPLTGQTFGVFFLRGCFSLKNRT
jgi:hypothetical protein